MIREIVILLFFIVFSLFEGHREAYFYHFASQSKEKLKNLHPYYFVFRLMVAVNISYLFFPENIICFLLKLLCFGLIFPFFHDGIYYSARNVLNPDIYPLRWKDYGNGSAIMDFNTR